MAKVSTSAPSCHVLAASIFQVASYQDAFKKTILLAEKLGVPSVPLPASSPEDKASTQVGMLMAARAGSARLRVCQEKRRIAVRRHAKLLKLWRQARPKIIPFWVVEQSQLRRIAGPSIGWTTIQATCSGRHCRRLPRFDFWAMRSSMYMRKTRRSTSSPQSAFDRCPAYQEVHGRAESSVDFPHVRL